MGAYGGEAHNTCRGQKTTCRSHFSFFHTVGPPDQNMVSAMVTSAIIHCCISQTTNFIFFYQPHHAAAWIYSYYCLDNFLLRSTWCGAPPSHSLRLAKSQVTRMWWHITETLRLLGLFHSWDLQPIWYDTKLHLNNCFLSRGFTFITLFILSQGATWLCFLLSNHWWTAVCCFNNATFWQWRHYKEQRTDEIFSTGMPNHGFPLITSF